MIELKLPEEAGEIFMDLSKGGYLISGTPHFDTLRDFEEDMVSFCRLFKHQLHIADMGYAYLESFNRGNVTLKNTQYLAFFSVFFPLFQQMMVASPRAWYDEICGNRIDMSEYDFFGLTHDTDLLQTVKINNFNDIKDLLKKMSDDKILTIRDGVTVVFQTPIHRFIAIFHEMSREDLILNNAGGEDA